MQKLPPSRLSALTDSLLSVVCRLSPKRQATEWGAYYSDTNYSDEALEAKRHLVQELVRLVAPKTWWDVGGNNGFFSHAVRDLIAIYSKGRCDSYVYPTVTPVNVMRVIFACLSGDRSLMQPLATDISLLWRGKQKLG